MERLAEEDQETAATRNELTRRAKALQPLVTSPAVLARLVDILEYRSSRDSWAIVNLRGGVTLRHLLETIEENCSRGDEPFAAVLSLLETSQPVEQNPRRPDAGAFAVNANINLANTSFVDVHLTYDGEVWIYPRYLAFFHDCGRPFT